MKKPNIILVHLAPTRSGHNFLRRNLCSCLGIHHMLHYWNYEGISPDKFSDRYDKEYENLQSSIERVAKRSSKRKPQVPEFIKVISNRDLLDWMASIYRQSENAGREPGEIDLEDWAKYTEEIFSEDSEFIGFTYDSFRDSREYRQHICNRIGGNYDEGFIDYIPSAGNGSSFTDQKTGGSSLQTGKRYLNYINHLTYRSNLRKYPKVVDLYKRTFVPSPEKLAFLETLDK